MNKANPSKVEVTVLILDRSPSMAATDFQPTRLAAAQQAAVTYIRRKRILDGRDRCAVVAFADTAVVASAFGRHPVEAQADVSQLTTSPATNVTAGLRCALQELMSQTKELTDTRLRAVLLTDGEHNTGRAPAEDGVLAELKRHAVIVDAVLIGNEGEPLMRQIAKATGGVFLLCRDFPSLISHYENLASKKLA